MIGEAVASKIPVHVAKSLSLIDERLRETGSGRDGAHGVANTRGVIATHTGQDVR